MNMSEFEEKETPVQGAPAWDEPVQGTPARGASAWGEPVQGAPAQGTPAWDEPVQVAPVQGAPAWDEPVQGTPTQGAPAWGEPAHGTPAQWASAQEEPMQMEGAQHYPPRQYGQPPYYSYYHDGRQAPGIPERDGMQAVGVPNQSFRHGSGVPEHSGVNNAHGQSERQWEFADYTTLAGPARETKSRKTVVAVAVSICAVSLLLCFFLAFSLYTYITETDIQRSAREAASAEGEANTARGGAVASSFEIVPQPAGAAESAAEGGALTTAQVAEKLIPVVVGVVPYDDSQRFIRPTGGGSGIIMSADGYIITNAHVVEDAAFVRVMLSDDVSYEASIIGMDARTDLAVIKVEADDLPAAVFGDSDAMRVGDTVIAVGNPAGRLTGTVTQGIVSALNRDLDGGRSRYAMRLIQTDAAINPGNSGGALVNIYGQVVGIPSSKIVAPEYEGIGFAIPITDAKPVIDDLLAHGRVVGRVMLGIQVELVDELASRNHDVPMGVQITWMNPESDISNKDARPGDIITHVNGDRIFTVEDVWQILDEHEVGDSVRLTLYRQTGIGGDSLDISVVLQEDVG